jgi:hypothetical protein
MMQGGGFKAMGSSLGGMALGVGGLAPAQQQVTAVPAWAFVVGAIVVLAIGVIWVLWEEKEETPQVKEAPAAEEAALAEPEAEPAAEEAPSPEPDD